MKPAAFPRAEMTNIVYIAVMQSVRVPLSLQQAVMRTMRQKLAQANNFFQATFPEPQITYRQRGTIAGCARLQDWEIRLNPVLSVIPHPIPDLKIM